MGGAPLFALALVGMPVNQLPLTVIRKILEGGESVCTRAGIPIALSQGMRPKPRLSLPLPLPVGAAGADEKHGFVRRVMTFPLHPEHATQAIEHGTHPASIVVAADDVDRADLMGGRMQFVDEVQHPLFMRHRDQHAGQVPRRTGTRNERRQVIRFDHEWDAGRVDVPFDEDPVQQFG